MAAAREQIEAADLGNEQTIDALEGIRFTPAGEEAARAVLTSSASGDVLWAATWVYASSATDPAPLAPFLQNADASIRAMAAATLVARGDQSGFDALAGLLAEAGNLRGSSPPISIGGFAAFTLSRSVQAADAPLPPATAADLAAVEEEWSAWLQAHGDALVFDAESGTWTQP